jgi:hypothetical protein
VPQVGKYGGRTGQKVGQDGPMGVADARAQQSAGGAAHQEGGSAARQAPQLPRGQVLLRTPVPAEHKQVALRQCAR